MGLSCAQVMDALGRIGKVEGARALVKPILPCAEPFRYRNKMGFSFAQDVPQLPRAAGFGLRHVSNPKEVPILSFTVSFCFVLACKFFLRCLFEVLFDCTQFLLSRERVLCVLLEE